MTKKQLLFPVLILGVIGNIALAMEENTNQPKIKVFDKKERTELLDDTLEHSIYNTNFGKNQKINIVKYDNEPHFGPGLKGRYVVQGTIYKLNYFRPHTSVKTQADVTELTTKLEDLMNHVENNNAIFCLETEPKTVIYNTTKSSRCIEIAALYEMTNQKLRDEFMSGKTAIYSQIS